MAEMDSACLIARPADTAAMSEIQSLEEERRSLLKDIKQELGEDSQGGDIKPYSSVMKSAESAEDDSTSTLTSPLLPRATPKFTVDTSAIPQTGNPYANALAVETMKSGNGWEIGGVDPEGRLVCRMGNPVPVSKKSEDQKSSNLGDMMTSAANFKDIESELMKSATSQQKVTEDRHKAALDKAQKIQKKLEQHKEEDKQTIMMRVKANQQMFASESIARQWAVHDILFMLFNMMVSDGETTTHFSSQEAKISETIKFAMSGLHVEHDEDQRRKNESDFQIIEARTAHFVEMMRDQMARMDGEMTSEAVHQKQRVHV